MRRASWRSVPITCKPPTSGDAGAQLDVGAAARHVGGDRDRAALAGARDDFGFLLVILRVEHRVEDPLPLEHAARALR